MSEVKTAKYEIISSIWGNRYKFYDDLSGALIVTTKAIKAENLEKELSIAWERYGRKYFNRCEKCGKYISDMMFNADVHNCVECTPWEMRPHFCSVCGNSVTTTDRVCRGCGNELQYKEVFKKNAKL
ncbi:MAG: hypothetical protein IJ272_04560 [Clostridia bacterium]|nr:hypothetical protein [Clostridia bacterium]